MTIRTPLTLATVHPDTGLRAALGQAPAEVVEEVARSGIRGRGGAGFRTGLKWRLASEAPAPDAVATSCATRTRGSRAPSRTARC